jgi:hypothetical protein
MPSISMEDFQPHLPSDDREATLSSETWRHDGPAALLSGPASPPGPRAPAQAGASAPTPPTTSAPAAPRQLLRDLFVMAILLHMLDGGGGTPLGRRRRTSRMAARHAR